MADSKGFNWNGILETGLGALGGSLINGSLGLLGQDRQLAKSKELLDYQWNKMYSPLAQVKNLAAAGVNPAAAFANNAPVFNSGGQLSMPDNPFGGIGTSSLTDISNYLLAKANAKKAGADTRKADAEADAVSFENELNRVFKQPERVANLMSAYKSLQLQDDEHSRNEWINAKEKALSELTGIQKDTAEKVFNNMDTQIKLENMQRQEEIKLTQEKQKTEKTSQSANVAAANASNTQADVNRAVRRLQSALADVEESGKTYKIESLISEYQKNKSISDADAKEANIKLSRLRELEYKRDSRLFGEVDNFLEWIKGKVSIFH